MVKRSPSIGHVYRELAGSDPLTVPETAEKMSLRQDSARDYLDELVDIGLVRMKSTRNTVVVWVPDPSPPLSPISVRMLSESHFEILEGETSSIDVLEWTNGGTSNIFVTNSSIEQLKELNEPVGQRLISKLVRGSSGSEQLEAIPNSPYHVVEEEGVCLIVKEDAHEDAFYVMAIGRCPEIFLNETGDGCTREKETEILLSEYSEIRQEIRSIQELQHRRVTGGMTAMGAIVGYGLISENGLEIVALIPVIIALMFVLTIQTTYGILYLGRQGYDIEQRLDVEAFGWESRFGAVIRDNERHSLWESNLINWALIPNVMIYSIIAFIYFTMIGISIFVLRGSDLQTVFNFPIELLALGVYTIMTIISIISGIAYYKTSLQIQP